MMRRNPTVAAKIAVLVEAPAWRRVRGAAVLVRKAARAALDAAAVAGRAELCVVLTDDRTMQRLNLKWRGKDKPTNVLSFPAGGAPDVPGPCLLGDVVIAFGVVAAEAAAQGKTPAAHLAHLVVHGVLHLLGHDHERSAEATRMEALEKRILRRLGVADPYRVGDRRAA
jgi:probable rRNA maturation factor